MWKIRALSPWSALVIRPIDTNNTHCTHCWQFQSQLERRLLRASQEEAVAHLSDRYRVALLRHGAPWRGGGPHISVYAGGKPAPALQFVELGSESVAGYLQARQEAKEAERQAVGFHSMAVLWLSPPFCSSTTAP